MPSQRHLRICFVLVILTINRSPWTQLPATHKCAVPSLALFSLSSRIFLLVQKPPKSKISIETSQKNIKIKNKKLFSFKLKKKTNKQGNTSERSQTLALTRFCSDGFADQTFLFPLFDWPSFPSCNLEFSGHLRPPSYIMVTTAVAAAFLPIAPVSDSSGKTTSGKIVGGVPSTVDVRGNNAKSKSTSPGKLQVKANAQALPKVNGTKVGSMNGFKTEDEVMVSPPPRTFINQLPDWSMLLAAITTIFLAAEKQWMMLDWKPKRADMFDDPFGLGRIMQDSLVFRQNFSIRSYEIGADRTASVETMMNHLQETALNHVRNAGLLADGFGSTPEMCKRNLIWVVTKMQVLVDRKPTWGDVVQVDTWVSASGKNGMRRDWLVRDSNTGAILTRASSLWVMMNKETRKLSKMPDEVREEIGVHFVDSPPIVDDDTRKLPKLDDNTADYIHSGLTPRWSDLDVNQHVNNVKYVGWILESAPKPIVETHELAGMTLEYRRECMRDSVLQSLTSVVDDKGKGCGIVECQHLLRLEGGGEIVKGRTHWRPKFADMIGSLGQHPIDGA